MGRAAFADRLLFIARRQPVTGRGVQITGRCGQPFKPGFWNFLHRLAHVIGNIRGHTELSTIFQDVAERQKVILRDKPTAMMSLFSAKGPGS